MQATHKLNQGFHWPAGPTLRSHLERLPYLVHIRFPLTLNLTMDGLPCLFWLRAAFCSTKTFQKHFFDWIFISFSVMAGREDALRLWPSMRCSSGTFLNNFNQIDSTENLTRLSFTFVSLLILCYFLQLFFFALYVTMSWVKYLPKIVEIRTINLGVRCGHL